MVSSSDRVRVGDVWTLIYQDTPVRMKVSRVEADGQILLVEINPPTERAWIRTVLSSYKQLIGVGMPDCYELPDPEDA